MKKHLVFALMAFASFAMVSCGSDDDDNNGGIIEFVENVISVANSSQKQGAMPQATQTLNGVIPSITNNPNASGANIEITSPVALAKFFVSIAGLDGYLECPAQLVGTRAEAQTYKYIINILVKPGVSQNVTVVVNAETVEGDVVAILKEKLDVQNEEQAVDSPSALVGTWEFVGEQIQYSLTITPSTFTYVGDQGNSEGSYKFEDGMLYMTSKGDTAVQKMKPTLLASNNALLLRPYYMMQDENGQLVEASDLDDFELFIKKGAKVKCDIADAQGTWIWHLRGNQEIVRSALIIKDNTFDMIIPVWGQRMKGTVTYDNLYLNFKVNKLLTRDSEEYYGESLDRLYDGWQEDVAGDAPFGMEFSRPFVADGNVAYSNLANLPVYYVKK